MANRGTVVVRDLAGPAGASPDAPALCLLHGWTATADLNFFRCYYPLAAHHRVFAFDHRGHGSGLRSRKPFRLEDCADDAADVATALGIERFIPVGYSMGGPVAQLVWRRHPERVAGLVLCATAPYFAGRRPERRAFLGLTGLATLARFTPEQARTWLTDQFYLNRKSEWEPWAMEAASTHDWRMILEAGAALGEFSSSEWLGEVDVPTSIVMTMRDQVVPPRRQTRLFEMIPDARGLPGRRRARCGGGSSPPVRARTAQSRRVDSSTTVRWGWPLAGTGLIAAGAAIAVRRLAAGDGHHAVGRSRAGRNARLARMGARVGATYASTAARKTFASAERRVELDRDRELRTAAQVAEELGHMKGALMKLGQMASYLDDGLPEPLRIALSQLQSNAPPMSTDLAIRTVETELGRALHDVFLEFDPEPIAAASIGQVHRALIADPVTGLERAVAVKVQYPGVDEAIVSDLRNADLLGVLLQQGFGGLDPAEMVDEIKIRLAEEVDYEREAANQQLFVDHYRDHPFIKIPEVVHSLSTRRVLTTELADGFTWSELLTASQADRDRAGEVIFRFVFRGLYRLGAFNGDPHPGNYLFHDDGSVTFLDFGLVKHFSDAELQTFGAMVKAAAIDHDDATFRRILEDAGMLKIDAPVDTAAVGEYFSHFYDTVRRDEEMTWTREYANSIVRHTFDRTSPISQYATVPRSFVFIQRINLGLYALLGELGATGNYRRIASELWPFVNGEPSTALGRAEADWIAARR